MTENKLSQIENSNCLFKIKCVLSFLLIYLFTFSSFSSADELKVFTSGENHVSIIELYTSEGCSSCPPADLWLNKLESENNLWNQFIPLSFHVDYWDYLGWKDKFSRVEFSQRQRRYAELGQVSGVYTPGMFLDGLEWRKWRGISPAAFVPNTQNNKSGKLELRYSANAINVEFESVTEHKINPISVDRAYIALLGFNLASSVKSGENSGKKFAHNFVVLELMSSDLQFQQGKHLANFNSFKSILDLNNGSATDYAIAAWVTHEGDSKPLQATGGWLSKDRE